MTTNITACIVLYKNDYKIIAKNIQHFLSSNLHVYLYLVDNSPTDALRILKNIDRITYIHNPTNPGFGSAHNIAIERAIKLGAKYHFVINPDVFIQDDVVTSMIKYMQQNLDVGMMMPQILNEDGSVQNLPKLLPSPYSVIMRKLKIPNAIYNRFIDRYELRSVPQNIIYNAPILSGCFTLLNVEAIKEVGMYDDNYFMYFEDWDLSRRMHKKYKTIFYPEVSVYHGYESGANKSLKLFKIFVNSAITYFNKWGWFLDSERRVINRKALAQFK
jgi:GT2 family glycosyltransferase